MTTTGLRFDKVATRLVKRVQSGLRSDIPTGTRAFFAVTAPIRLPSKTAGEIEMRVRTLLRRRGKRIEESAMVSGNGVFIRIERQNTKAKPTIRGVVHNRGLDPSTILSEAFK